jgi:DNA polymerase (family 10)
MSSLARRVTREVNPMSDSDLDAGAIARALLQAANLYEIDEANPFKVRALRQAAERIAAAGRRTPASVDDMCRLPGVGAGIAAMIRSIAEKGPDAFLASLPVTVPASLQELLAIPSIGPKRARMLYRTLGVTSLSDLQATLTSGHIHRIPGFGIRQIQRLRSELEAMLRRQSLLPIAIAWPTAVNLTQQLAGLPGTTRAEVTGDARRLVVECRQIECVCATTNPQAVTDWAEAHGGTRNHPHRVDLVLPIANRRIPVHIHLAPVNQFALVWLETTGDASHQAVIRRIAQDQGLTWRDGALWTSDGRLLECSSEEEVYERLGLPYYPPELREGRGLLQDPRQLVQVSDIRGDLHVHTHWSDGIASIRTMALAARERGYEYLAITDHSRSLTVAGGLSIADVRRQGEEIQRLNEELTGITLLRGIEVDILADGRLDLPDDLLWELDIVVASVHIGMHQSREDMTERIVRAIEHPAVDIIGHLTGRIIGRREPYPLDFDRIIAAATAHGVCLELNSNPNRLDLSDDLLRRAVARGIRIAIDTDAHAPEEFRHIEYGIRMGHRGWLRTQDVLNTLPLAELRRHLHQGRSRCP